MSSPRSDLTRVSWSGMWKRCRGQVGPVARALYCERGIRVCERWKDFSAFVADMGPRPSRAHSIDRIDNDKGYEPGNCRWATRDEQRRNQRNVCMIEHAGKRQCQKDWARELGVAEDTIARRRKRGMSLDEILVRGPGEPSRTHQVAKAKLSADTVREIRRAWAQAPRGQKALAKRFGVSQTLVWLVLSGRRWAHVAVVCLAMLMAPVSYGQSAPPSGPAADALVAARMAYLEGGTSLTDAAALTYAIKRRARKSGRAFVDLAFAYSQLGASHDRARFARELPDGDLEEWGERSNRAWSNVRRVVGLALEGRIANPCPMAVGWGGVMDRVRPGQVPIKCRKRTANWFYRVEPVRTVLAASDAAGAR